MATGHLSYYETEEIEAAVFDLLDLSMVDDAEYLAEAGLNMHPNDEDTEKLLIWIYLHNHKADKAEQMYAKYRDDGSAWSSRMEFSMSVMHGHPQQALERYVVELANGHTPARDWIDAIDEMFDALPSAVLAPYLEKAAKYIGQDAETMGRLGSMLFDVHSYEAAARTLESALDLDAYDIYSWQDLARCYMMQQDFEKCMEACDYGLAVDENNALLGFIKGYILYQYAEYAACIPFLNIACRFAEGRIDMHNVNATEDEIQQQIDITYELLGFAYLETNKNEQAHECFTIWTGRNPRNIVARLQLATIALLEGDLNTANDHANEALAIDPKYDAARSLQISILMSMHDFEGAYKSLKLLLHRKPRNQEYLFAFAQLCVHMHRDKEAETSFRKLLKMHIKNKEFRKMIRDYFIGIGDYEAAEEAGGESIEN